MAWLSPPAPSFWLIQRREEHAQDFCPELVRFFFDRINLGHVLIRHSLFYVFKLAAALSKSDIEFLKSVRLLPSDPARRLEPVPGAFHER